eukprot:COSAG02_NODE_3102_length_7368_cov_92.599120_10_plen_64_part_00
MTRRCMAAARLRSINISTMLAQCNAPTRHFLFAHCLATHSLGCLASTSCTHPTFTPSCAAQVY